MSTCKVCANRHSRFTFENKLVCLKCDELLFDIAIETDEAELKTQGSEVADKETKGLRATAKQTQRR